MKTASPLQLKSISGTHVSYGHRHFVLSVIPLADVYVSSALASRRSLAWFLSISAGKVSYSWAVYLENPPSFSWVEEGSQQWGTLIPVHSWHWHTKRTQNAPKCIKSLNYLSLLRFSLLLPNCEGSHSAYIYKFKYKNSKMHASMEGPPHPNMPGEGASLSRWPPFFRSGMKNSNWATTTDMSHVLHLHTNTILSAHL